MSDDIFFINRKGGTILLYGSHQYYKVKTFKNNYELWRCSNYKKLKCSGNIIIINTTTEKNIAKTREHSCPPDICKNEVAKQVAMLKEKVCKSTKPIPYLYEKAKNKNKGLDIVAPLPPLSSVQHCLYDIRNKGLCVNKTTFSNIEDVVLPAQFENFILADYYYEGSRIIIFCPPSTRTKIGAINEIMGDGTFKCCPKPFYQLYSIFGDIGSSIETTNVTPLLFALLPNKKEITYNIMFSLIKSQLPEFNPMIYHCDFEQGAINGIQMVYPKVEVRGCFYHWHRALWRKAKFLNLKSKGQKRIVGLTAALPLLPDNKMLDGLHYIISEGSTLNMDNFFKYVEGFWKIRYFKAILCVFGQRFRTNNVLEGFHAKLSKKINKNSTNLLRLLTVLSTITIAKSKRRKLDVKNDDYIKDIQRQLINNDISVGVALEKLR